MRFDLVSDVHEDTGWRGRPLRTGSSETLVIAGDVGNGVEVTVAAVTALAREYGQVVFVDGNHEFYSSGGEIDRTRDRLQEAFPANVHYLDRKGPFCLGNTAFAGANGWYQFHEPSSGSFRAQSEWWSWRSNDARLVFPGGDPQQALEQWEESRRTLFRQLECARDDPAVEHVVVVTHSVPHSGGLRDGYVPASNGSYYNGLFEEAKNAGRGLLAKMRVWCFGHTHHPALFRDQTSGADVWFVANPRGYRHERRNPRRNRIVEVDVEDPGY